MPGPQDVEAYCASKHPELQAQLREHGGRRWLELSAVLGPVAHFNHYVLLLHNFDLSVGQVVEVDGHYVFRQAIPLDGPDLGSVIDAVAAQAAKSRTAYEVKTR